MAKSVLVDSSFLVALLSGRDAHHLWAVAQSHQHPPPWSTCEAVLSEAFLLLGDRGAAALTSMLRRQALASVFSLAKDLDRTLKLMEKYVDVPMTFADACLVRMTEAQDDPLLLTTDTDFRVYRRHGRAAVPCAMPARS